MAVVIRRARHGDEVALAQLSGVVQTIHVDARPDIFVGTSAADLAGWFGGVLDRPSQSAWLAENGGSPVGYLLAVIHDRPRTPFTMARRWCEIDQLGVAEGMRGRGVARALVDAAIGWARERGIAQVSAQCWSFNLAAQAAFARLGFEPMSLRLERSLEGRNRPAPG